jgi:hypothetical protein
MLRPVELPGVKVPAGQSRQLSKPQPLLNLPDPHSTQYEVPPAPPVYPIEHVHEDRPHWCGGSKRESGHVTNVSQTHADCDVLPSGEEASDWQGAHVAGVVAATVPEKVFAAQETQELLPMTSLYDPGEQAVQS